ncbi:MAG: hypothetical protein KQI62_11015 [Deltaproteobacteria bacterium]|nr:hypothetical protein [Deltaproteobacteria bacterium]
MQRLVIATLTLCLALSLAACMGPNSQEAQQQTDRLLMSSDFQFIPANTPERMKHLESMPQNRILHVVRNGKDYYLWADAKNGQCLWVGTWKDYQRFKKLAWDMYNQGGQARYNYVDGWSSGPVDWEMWGPW